MTSEQSLELKTMHFVWWKKEKTSAHIDLFYSEIIRILNRKENHNTESGFNKSKGKLTKNISEE